MNKQTAIQTILNAGSYFEKQSAGYKSWGKVTVLQIALRTDENEFLISSPTKSITSLTEKDITVLQSDSYIAEIFSKKKKIQAILITKQEYASQIKEEGFKCQVLLKIHWCKLTKSKSFSPGLFSCHFYQ